MNTICPATQSAIAECLRIFSPFILYAFSLGFIPALLWLKLWLNEDHEHPEPPKRIISSFLLGSLAAVGAYIIPQLLNQYTNLFVADHIGFLAVLIIVAIEEILKFSGAAPALASKDDDEPVDAMIYLITAALGFVAVENTLYAFGEIMTYGNMAGAYLTAERFIGASLIHVVSSATIGMGFSATFFNRKWRPYIVAMCITLGIGLHASFNFLIIQGAQVGTGTYIAGAFAFTWVMALLLLIVFETIKKKKI